jgi:SAM-dependent methyltransferase
VGNPVLSEATATDPKEAARERAREIAARHAERGDVTSWFDELYREAAGDIDQIPWADLEPNKFLVRWAEKYGFEGKGRKAIVVGCGLGDDARYLYDRGFDVTAFDISRTAIEWAREIHRDTGIRFATADLLYPPKEWYQAFDFVLEVYTIQPLPLEMRPSVIDAVANLVALGGVLLVVTRGREDDEVPDELPWALSRRDLSRFMDNGLVEEEFDMMFGDEEEPVQRFVIKYQRPPRPVELMPRVK